MLQIAAAGFDAFVKGMTASPSLGNRGVCAVSAARWKQRLSGRIPKLDPWHLGCKTLLIGDLDKDQFLREMPCVIKALSGRKKKRPRRFSLMVTMFGAAGVVVARVERKRT
jgi:hypothetical protein